MSASPTQLFREFAQTYLAPARQPEDIIPEPALDARFRRWAAARSYHGNFDPRPGRDGRPWSFRGEAKKLGIRPVSIDVGGKSFVVYESRWVVPEDEQEVRASREVRRLENEVTGRLEVVEPLVFVDVTIQRGEELERVKPSTSEQRKLDELFEREGRDFGARARPWLVMLVGGRRRICRSSCFRKKR